MAFGVDYVSGPSMAALKANGVSFVCRYLCYLPNSKVITRSEAQTIMGAGIHLVLNFEWTATRMKAGYSAGVADANESQRQAALLGLPQAPVYFSADWDCTEGDQTAINAYLDGAASVLGRGRVGLYGGYWPIKRAFDAGKITWGWQAFAWSGGEWDPRAHIQQYRNNVALGSAQVDFDRNIKADFGGNPRPAPPSPVKPPIIPPAATTDDEELEMILDQLTTGVAFAVAVPAGRKTAQFVADEAGGVAPVLRVVTDPWTKTFTIKPTWNGGPQRVALPASPVMISVSRTDAGHVPVHLSWA